MEPGDDELLWRRVRPQMIAGDPPRATAAGFSPSSRDKEGLSIGRKEIYGSPEEFLRATSAKPGDQYWVVEFRYEELKRVGASATIDRPEEDLGHALLPELSLNRKKADRQGFNSARERVLNIENARLLGPFVLGE